VGCRGRVTATVFEVRIADRTGLVWRVCRAPADEQLDVRSAHLGALGPQAEDACYVTGRVGQPLPDDEAGRLRRTLERALDV